MRTTIIFILVVLFYCVPVKAQSIDEIDATIAAYINKIGDWGGYEGSGDTVSKDDSLSDINAALCYYLMNACIKNPKIIKAVFPKANKTRITIISSDDNKLKLYSWDSWMGGTMRDYENIAQYQTKVGIRAFDMKDTAIEADYGTIYTSIATIHARKNKTVYLVQDYCVASTKDREEGITAYIIEGDSLKKVNLFHTKNKSLNSIGYGYDAFISRNKFPKKDLPTIHLSNDKKRLFIPIVSGPTKEEVTSKYLVYVFDGNNFVFDKNAK